MTNFDNAILLLFCPDKKGIVSRVSNFIFENDGNILNADQHCDSKTNIFYMRIEWNLENFKIKKENIYAEFFKYVADNFDMQFTLHFSKKKFNSAIFVSLYEHCLIDLLLKNITGELNTNFKVVIGNHKDIEKTVKHYNKDLEYFYIPITKENKIKQEQKQLEILKSYKIDLIILARYMQILSNNFIKEYPNKIINIHHSFLPAFIGANPYKQAFERGVKLIGATSHYITESLDEGPIIEQDIIRISHKNSEKDLINLGKDLEKSVLSKAVKLHLENKILVDNQKTIVFN
ncbi:MAG: formyltetrahydrofolate deformylase [Elusimicrobiota bacterium]|jgi:formyltetrahydrofolate deformylase|nr:formyltetrahydrofolate deformylase [Elusimicrobiota bacterium]